MILAMRFSKKQNAKEKSRQSELLSDVEDTNLCLVTVL